MSVWPQYKLVNGEMVQLTQDEIDANEADATKQKRAESLSKPLFDQGPSMAEILLK